MADGGAMAETTAGGGYQHRLKTRSVGFPGVLMQSVAQISPTLGIFYTIAFNTGQTGITAPLTYLVAFILCLTLAVPLGGLAREMPSAGGYYTYVSRALGPDAGLMTGWLYGVSVALVPCALAAFTGAVLHDELYAEFGFGLAWWVYAVAILVLCYVVAFRGIVISARFMMTMGLAEIVVGLALAATGLARPGPGGLNVSGFNPANIHSQTGFFLAVVLSIFAFTGFESAAAIGEESREPRRLIPAAIVGSVVMLGVFYVLTAWGLQIGWGTSHLTALANSPTAPAFVLAKHLWGIGWVLVLIALLNSGIGVCIACTTSSTRTLYGMARTGALPGIFGAVHPKHKTPYRAVMIQSAAAVLLCLVLGGFYGPTNLFDIFGVAGTFAYILIYGLGNVAAWRYFRALRRASFNVFYHVVFPLIGTAALIYIGYKSIVPVPAYPVWIGPIITAIYVVTGLAALLWARRPDRAGWRARAGELPDVTGEPATVPASAQPAA
jgi:amino acid transporter